MVAFLVLAGASLFWFWPAPERGFLVDVVFPRGHAGLSEPLIVAGEPGAGEFLFVRYVDETHAVLGYERWGVGPQLSEPFDGQPGSRRRLIIDVPPFSMARGGSRGGDDHLRVSLDGQDLLSGEARFNLRKSSRIFFAENPLGGTACTGSFSGALYHPEGRLLLGNARRVFSWRERLAGWFTDGKWQVVFVALASIGIGAAWRQRANLLAAIGEAGRRAGDHRAFLLTAFVCNAAFAWVISGGTGRLWFEESFGDFFDLQAAALLHGRLDVPEGAISGEAFVARGKYYGYFGLTAALLRLPFAIFDFGTGWWSRIMMVGYHAGSLVAAYAFLRAASRLVGADRPATWATVLFTLNVGMGSTLFFLSSRAYIYHETTLCGAMFALGSAVAALRYFSHPGVRPWLLAFVFALLALHARPPIGLHAFVLLAGVSLVRPAREALNGSRSLPAALVPATLLPLACVLGVFTFNAVSFAKFRSFDGAPLRYHVQYPAKRLAHIEGRNFHVENLRYGFSMYVWRPAFELRATFPWFYMTGKDPGVYPETKIDLAEPMVALPYAMPALTLLATVGLGIACRRHRALRLPGALFAAAVLPMAVALFTAVAVSQRYTADFCPWLISLAALALAGLNRMQLPARAGLAIVTACSIAITAAITLHYQGTGVWGVPDDVSERYRQVRLQVDRFFGVTNPELSP